MLKNIHMQAVNAQKNEASAHVQAHIQRHTQTVFRATAQETGPPVPVLAIQPLNLAFMNGNIFSFRPKCIPKQI